MPLDREIVRIAASQTNKLFGQWMPERWLNLFIDAYDDIEACRTVPDEVAGLALPSQQGNTP